MVAQARRSHLNLPLAPLVGAVCGVILAFAIVLVPLGTLEDVIIASGLPAILPAAEPPLGVTARLGVTLVAAGGAGVLAWFVAFLAVGSRSVSFGRPAHAADPAIPVLRRADAHPDAPARRPLFANEDLGTPFLDIRAAVSNIPVPNALVTDTDAGGSAASADDEADALLPMPELEEFQEVARSIPDDLDLPLSAFDPDAIPTTAILPEQRVAPLSAAPMPRPQMFDPGERFETFELTPLIRAEGVGTPSPIRRDSLAMRPDTEATVAALLERLERCVAQRGEYSRPQAPGEMPVRAGSLDRTLGALRQMATRTA